MALTREFPAYSHAAPSSLTTNLQITPGSGHSGTISMAYSGAPVGANIQGPSTLQISNGNPTTFTVSVTTSAGTSSSLPFFIVPLSIPFSIFPAAPGLILAVILVLLLALGAKCDSDSHCDGAHFPAHLSF